MHAPAPSPTSVLIRSMLKSAGPGSTGTGSTGCDPALRPDWDLLTHVDGLPVAGDGTVVLGAAGHVTEASGTERASGLTPSASASGSAAAAAATGPTGAAGAVAEARTSGAGLRRVPLDHVFACKHAGDVVLLRVTRLPEGIEEKVPCR